jgi:hypothetical protein
MIAHAIRDDVDRLELYGVDMASGTEYAYQKAGTEYMIGLAIGRGMDVYIPPKSFILNAPLYGYDADAECVDRATIERHRAHYQDRLAALTEYGPEYWLHDGAQAICAMILENFLADDYTSRQTVEVQNAKAAAEMSKANNAFNYFSGRISAGVDENAARQQAYERLFIHDGAAQATAHLIAHMDIRPYNLELKPSNDLTNSASSC